MDPGGPTLEEFDREASYALWRALAPVLPPGVSHEWGRPLPEQIVPADAAGYRDWTPREYGASAAGDADRVGESPDPG